MKAIKNTSGNSSGNDPAVSSGRRTSLSLGPNSGKSNKPQVVDVVDITTNNKQLQELTSIIDLTTENKNGNSSISTDTASTTKEKIIQKPQQENGQDEKKSNGHKTEKSSESSKLQKDMEINKSEGNQIKNVDKEEIKLKAGPKSKKEKELKEIKEKLAASAQTSITTKNETIPTISIPTKSTNNENVSKSPTKRSQRNIAMASNTSVSSLAADKDLKGFHEKSDSLIYQDKLSISTLEATVAAIKESNATKIKDITSPQPKISNTLHTKASNSKLTDNKNNEKGAKEEEKQNLYKQSSEISIKFSNIPVPITSSTPDGKKIPLVRPPSSLRQISGRRSLHPSKDCSFQSQYRETYRKTNTELDYTNSSLNVTVGSELALNDSTSSLFSFWGRGRKRDRATPPPTLSSSTDVLNVESPKRPRLDFSGLFGLVASPVTMLRAKLSRAKIENNDIYDIDGVQKLDEINRNEEETLNENKQDNENSKDNLEDEQSDISLENIDDKNVDIELIDEKNPKNSDDADDLNESDNDVEIVEEVHKRRCNVM